MTDISGGQPAGWYYAQGDPAGTQRYWDGTQWQGSPQPVSMAPGVSASGTAAPRTAENGARFVAFLIDSALMVVAWIALIVLIAVFGSISDAAGGVVLLVGLLALLGFGLYNGLYLPGKTGQSIGKKQQNIKIINVDTGGPPGIGMVFARAILSGLISILFYLDHWWILVDADNRRPSDKTLSLHVVAA